jgi:hypothetical protein
MLISAFMKSDLIVNDILKNLKIDKSNWKAYTFRKFKKWGKETYIKLLISVIVV